MDQRDGNENGKQLFGRSQQGMLGMLRLGHTWTSLTPTLPKPSRFLKIIQLSFSQERSEPNNANNGWP